MILAKRFLGVALVVFVPTSALSQTAIERFETQLAGYRTEIQDLREEIAALRSQKSASTGDATSVPEGAVVAFVGGCPAVGWQPYFPASGRFIVGAGPHGGNDENRNLGLDERPLPVFTGPGDLSEETLRIPSASNTGGKIRAGGVEYHALEPQEMPNHGHRVVWSSGGKEHTISLNAARGDDPDDAQFQLKTGGAESGQAGRHLLTTQEGASAPHNNMPPFIALYFCKKEG